MLMSNFLHSLVIYNSAHNRVKIVNTTINALRTGLLL